MGNRIFKKSVYSFLVFLNFLLFCGFNTSSSIYLNNNNSFIKITVVIIFVIIWMASASYRTIRKDLRIGIFLISGLILCWLILSFLKKQLNDLSFANRMCWYGFYIFFMGIPLVLLYVSDIIDNPIPKKTFPKWYKLCLSIYPFLVLLVFTNDWHNLVFKFDINGNWNDVYTYGVGYYIVFAYCIFTFALSLYLLYKSSKKSPKKYAVAGPIIIALLIILYIVGYGLNWKFFRPSDISFTFSLFSILFLEAVLHAGFIPTNTYYRDLFSNSPMNMQILNSDCETVLESANSDEISPINRFYLHNNQDNIYDDDKEILIHSSKINGGYAVWQEDVSFINDLQKQIQVSVDDMENANTLLKKYGEIQKQKIAVEIKSELFESLEQDIAEKTKELSKMIKSLPESKNRQLQIIYIALVLCHIKRSSNIFFVSLDNNIFLGNDLIVYLDELSELASYANIKSLVTSGNIDNVTIEIASLCYDFYFYLISWSIKETKATLVGQLEKENGKLTFYINASEKTDNIKFPDTFLNSLEKYNVSLKSGSVDDMNYISLCFNEKGDD